MMKQGSTLMDITIGALSGVDAVIKKAKRILCLFTATPPPRLQAVLRLYNQVAIGHVEAGLRTTTINTRPTRRNEQANG